MDEFAEALGASTWQAVAVFAVAVLGGLSALGWVLDRLLVVPLRDRRLARLAAGEDTTYKRLLTLVADTQRTGGDVKDAVHKVQEQLDQLMGADILARLEAREEIAKGAHYGGRGDVRASR